MTVCDGWCGNKTSFVPKGIFKEINIKKLKLLQFISTNMQMLA